jgi:hypothetical protein
MKKDFNTTLEKIKSRGYWKVHIYPNKLVECVINPINKGKDIIRNSSVHLRGWDYPHYPTETQDHQDLYTSQNKVEAWIDWHNYKEIWRLFDSGQFIHFFGLREDWLAESWASDDHPMKRIQPGQILEVIGTIYSLTEIYAFLNNLVTNLDQDEVVIEISLVGTKGRDLHISDPGRAPLFMEYKSRDLEIVLPKKVYSKEEINSNFLELAFEQIIYIFAQFNWDNPPLEVIKEDQKKLIERRI